MRCFPENNNILFSVREAARTCPDMLLQKLLKDKADELSVAIRALAEDPTDLAMQHVNGLWARGVRLIELAKVVPPGAPRGGAKREGAKLAA